MGDRNQGDVGFSGELGAQSRSALDSEVFEKSGREAAIFFGSAVRRLTFTVAVLRRFGSPLNQTIVVGWSTIVVDRKDHPGFSFLFRSKLGLSLLDFVLV